MNVLLYLLVLHDLLHFGGLGGVHSFGEEGENRVLLEGNEIGLVFGNPQAYYRFWLEMFLFLFTF